MFQQPWISQRMHQIVSLSASAQFAVCAVGNPQQLGQKPVTFMRQVIALCAAPFLLEHPNVGSMFPADAIARAKTMLGYVGSIGAYSDSRGAPGIRQEVSNYIQKRDGCELTIDPCLPSRISSLPSDS